MTEIKRTMIASLLIEKSGEMKHKRPTELGFEDLVDVVQAVVKNCSIPVVSKRFDFDKLLQDYRQEFVNGGGYVKSDAFESGTEPYEVFEWFKNKLS